jgi:tetratricopeptide (TPR) repeat protein
LVSSTLLGSFDMQYLLMLLTLFLTLVGPTHVWAQKIEDEDRYNQWLNRARWYFWEGHHLEATRILHKLVELYPDRPRPYHILGDAYLHMGIYEKAAYWLTQCRNIQPDFPRTRLLLRESYRLKGIALLRRGEFEKAIRKFQEGIDAEPDFWEGYRWSGRIHLYQYRYQEARRSFEKARDQRPENFGIRLELGLCYLRLGLPEAARVELEGAIALNPTNMSARYNLGLIYARQGRWSDAWEQFHSAVTMGLSTEAFNPITE